MVQLQMTRFTALSVAGRKAFAQELDDIRARGRASTANQIRSGFGGVAVPILDDEGRTCAASNVFRFVPADLRTLDATPYLPVLRKAARDLAVAIDATSLLNPVPAKAPRAETTKTRNG